MVDVRAHGHRSRRLKYFRPQYQGSTFKIALFDQWLVVVSGTNMVDELMRRPDHEVSFLEGIEEVRNQRCLKWCIRVLADTVPCPQVVHMKYTVGHEAMSDPYHVGIIKEKLTRMLPTVLPDLTDELAVSVQ